MKVSSLTNDYSGAWYSISGPENDVVVSSRVRLARNLVNYPFPSRFTHEDGQTVKTLVFDAFSQIENADKYQTLTVTKLDEIGQKILLERGVLSHEYLNSPVAGIVVRSDGQLMCNVNVEDHLHLAAFCSGFDINQVYSVATDIDEQLQTKLQIAASVDFGYLTYQLDNLGTATKLSVYVHTPSLQAFNAEDSELTKVLHKLEKNNYSVIPAYGLLLSSENSFSHALGNCYQISTTECFSQNSEEQIDAFAQGIKSIIVAERLAREKMQDKKPTILRDSVYKALATVKYSRLLTEQEGIDLLFRLKWGKDSGILTKSDSFELPNLLYRIQDGHISFVNKTERFKFEKDVIDVETQVQRLRALIIQEALENIQIYS